MSIKKVITGVLFLGLITLLVIVLANWRINSFAETRITTKLSEIPKHKVGMVLGTAKYTVGGQINLFFLYRIDAVEKLYKADKIDYVLVSGDNGNTNYNEPQAFKEALVERGIPEEKIILDYAGFRTLDSVVRAKEVFGQNQLIIISQPFHNARAIYIANHFGIEAIGFNAQSVHYTVSIKVQLREYLARVKVFIDLLFKVQPKFLGEKILIE